MHGMERNKRIFSTACISEKSLYPHVLILFTHAIACVSEGARARNDVDA